LIFTEKDLQQVEKSLAVEKESEKGQRARNILNGTLKNNVNDLIQILSRPDTITGITGDERYNVVKELLIDSLGRGKVFIEQENKLPSALKTLLKFQKDPSGLFDAPPKHRGPGAEPMKHPYELLSTSAIIQKGQQGVNSSLSQTLRIYPTDRIDFGAKLPSKYGLSTKKLNTIEADTIIARKSGLIDMKLIGIDAKYSKSGSYSYVSDRQLEGIKSAFRDGSLDQFHFITNQAFTSGFKNAVEKANIDILQNRMKKDISMYKEVKNYLSMQEKKLNSYMPKINILNDISLKVNKAGESKDHNRSINKKIGEILTKNKKVMNKIASKYNVSQIGISEKVNYK